MLAKKAGMENAFRTFAVADRAGRGETHQPRPEVVDLGFLLLFIHRFRSCCHSHGIVALSLLNSLPDR